MHPMRLVAPVATLALCLSALAGPADSLAQSPSGALLTLTLAIANDQGEPSQPAIDAFVDQVATLSGGSIAIEPLYGAGNATQEGFEAGVAGLVERGEADLALNASRAWDLMGVTSLQALQAPFLITDGTLAFAVAEGDIAERALAGMADKGVTGLALWPEDLRHPFALGDHAPFLSPDDFVGATILVQPSALSRAMVTGLGATLYVDGDRDLDAAEGRLHGAESGLLQGHTLPGRPTATGDVTFYPKFQLISANTARLDALTPDQQAILREAAAETRRLTIAAHTSEADAAAAWCAGGGTIVLAGPDRVAAFEAAAQPILDQIGADPLTAQLIADITALKATTMPAPGATACGPEAVASPVPSAASDAVAGTWHTDKLTEDQVVAAFVARGGSESEGHDFFAQLGSGATQYAVIGMRFIDGRITAFEAGDGRPEIDSWGASPTYDVSAEGILTIHHNDGSASHFKVSMQEDRLSLAALDPCPADCHPYGETLIASFPFHRDAEATDPFTVVATLDQATTGLVHPHALAVGTDGNLYVADLEPSIRVISPTGQPIRSWGTKGAGPGELDFGPRAAIAIGADGLVYVLEGANHRIQVFEPDGTFVRQFGSFGAGPGQFVDPMVVMVDVAGDVYVVDDARQTLTKFDPTGATIWTIDASAGTDPDLVGHIHRGAFDSEGRLWLTNDGNGRVVAIDADGHKVDAYGGQGSGPGQFEGTFSIALDASGNAYVDECSDKRLQVLDPAHEVIGVLSAPTDLPFGDNYAFGPDGLLYAIAGGDHCAGTAPNGSVASDILVMKVTLPEPA